MLIVLGVLLLEVTTMLTSLLITRRNMLKNISEIGNRGYLINWDKINQNNGVDIKFDFEINKKSFFIPGLNIKHALDIKNNNLLVDNPILIPFLRRMTEKEKSEYNLLKTDNQKTKYITYKEQEEFIEKTEEKDTNNCEIRKQEELKVEQNSQNDKNNYINISYVENIIDSQDNYSLEDDEEGLRLSKTKK